jgi:hypothetical protein
MVSVAKEYLNRLSKYGQFNKQGLREQELEKLIPFGCFAKLT